MEVDGESVVWNRMVYVRSIASVREELIVWVSDYLTRTTGEYIESLHTLLLSPATTLRTTTVAG